MKIALVGEAWGTDEAYCKQPFVGAAGKELDRMLESAGIDRSACRITNVFNFQPPGNDIEALCSGKKECTNALPPIARGAYLRTEFLPELARLKAELEGWRPNVVVALGNTAAWALLGSSGISKLRGTTARSTLVDGLKVLPTYHPAAILRQWNLRAVTIIDLEKARREAEYPEIRRQRRELWLDPTLEDMDRFWEEEIVPATRCIMGRGLVYDIETKVLSKRRQMTEIGFAPSPFLAINIPFFDLRKPPTYCYWPTAGEELKALKWVQKVFASGITMIAQNGMYDTSWLWGEYGIPTPTFDEDTMLLHHALQPEAPKALDFLGSVYEDEMAWKLLNKGEAAKRDA